MFGAVNVSIHQYVVRSLQDCKGEWPQVTKATRVPLSTIARIASGETKNPRVKPIERLARYFQETASKKENVGVSERRAVAG